MVSQRAVARLCVYRRLLGGLLADGVKNVFSHQLANMAGCSAAQVRRDLMMVGYSGSPIHGYEVARLAESVREFLDTPGGQGIALVGVGNLGKAILSYFAGRRPGLQIVAAFDSDAYKVNRVIHGCRCHPVERLQEVAAEEGIRVGILTVPAPAAQGAAEALVRAGIRGLLNFAPVRLRVPAHVHVEDIDMAVVLEKVAFFARQGDAGSRPAEVGKEAAL